MANNCTPNIQAKLTDLYRLGPYRSNTGALDFAYSPANGSQLQAQMIQKNGKNSVYSITYRSSVCTTVVDCGDVECTDSGTATSGTSCQTFDSFSCYSSEWHNAEISTFRDLGSMEVQEVITGHVQDQIGKIKDKIDIALVVAMKAGAGHVSGSEVYKQIKLVDPITYAPSWNADTTIKLDFADMGYASPMPIIVGGRQVAMWKAAVERAGLANNGININQVDTLNAFYDINVNSTNSAPNVDGNDMFFAALPGVANVVTWSENTGMFASRNASAANIANIDPMRLVNTDQSTFLFTSLVDPGTGMVMDFDLVFDPKCKKFQWRVKCYYKVVTLPLVGCKDSDFTGIVLYDACPLSSTVDCATPAS